jgi:aminoglycoside/choline kinase family phosphotransferase
VTGGEQEIFPSTPERVREVAGAIVGAVAEVTPLAGDASSRRFYRIELASAPPLVAMALTGPLRSEDDPQLTVGRYLEKIGFPVSRWIGHDSAAGVILYEDLGDTLLEEVAQAAFPDMRSRPDTGLRTTASDILFPLEEPGGRGPHSVESLYSEAVRLLALLQGPGTRDLPGAHPSARVALDRDRFLFELDFFRENYIERHRRLTLSPSESGDLADLLQNVATEAATPPFVLCHRDYHSRNLLVTPEGIRVVDFQDARLGPVAYDLASLLRDSYVELPGELRERLFAEFVSRSPFPLEDRSFRKSFDWVALQRNLKAIGTFANQATVQGRPRYLTSIPLTWTYIFDEVERLPEIAGAGPLLRLISGGTT